MMFEVIVSQSDWRQEIMKKTLRRRKITLRVSVNVREGSGVDEDLSDGKEETVQRYDS